MWPSHSQLSWQRVKCHSSSWGLIPEVQEGNYSKGDVGPEERGMTEILRSEEDREDQDFPILCKNVTHEGNMGEVDALVTYIVSLQSIPH